MHRPTAINEHIKVVEDPQPSLPRLNLFKRMNSQTREQPDLQTKSENRENPLSQAPRNTRDEQDTLKT